MRCPLCGFNFEPEGLACRDAGCPLAGIQGCAMICCPSCGYQMVDERSSRLAGLLRGMQRKLAPPPPPVRSLLGLKAGQSATVLGLEFGDASLLEQLCAYGLAPGSMLRLEQTEPAFVISVGETVLSVDRAIAEGILVEPEGAAPAPDR